MARKVTRFMIRATENVGGRRRILAGEFKTKTEAEKRLEKLLSKPKKGRTSFRDAQSGTGIKNPRIVKRKVLR